MAAKVVYLKGGKCDGTLHTLNTLEVAQKLVVCKGDRYSHYLPHTTHDGHPVWTVAAYVPPPIPTGKPKAAKLHKGYADLQHSVNRNMPAALKASHRHMAAGLRSIRRASKVPL